MHDTEPHRGESRRSTQFDRQERRSVEIKRAFRRAEREQRELQRLKALHPQWSGLHFYPERLGLQEAVPTTIDEGE